MSLQVSFWILKTISFQTLFATPAACGNYKRKQKVKILVHSNLLQIQGAAFITSERKKKSDFDWI